MLNKAFNLADLGEPEMNRLARSFEELRQDFLRHRIPYHVDGEHEFKDGCLPRFWEYASAVHYGELGEDMRILDAGCGYSLLSPWLAKNGFQVWANDRTPFWKQRESQMQRIGKRFCLDLYDVAHTRYPDAYFDRVLCISVIEHIPEERIPYVMLEINRLLKDYGIVVVTFDLFKEHIRYGLGSFHGARSCQYFSGDSIQEALLTDTGFELVEPCFFDDTDWSSPPLFEEYNFGRVFLRKKACKVVEGTKAENREPPLRIANVSFDFYYGGIQEQVQILTEHSTNPTLEHLVVACGDGPLREWAENSGIPYAVITERDVASFCDSYRVDLVVSHVVNGSKWHQHLHAYELFALGIPTINLHYCAYKAQYPAWLFDRIITNAQSTVRYLPAGSTYSIVPLAVNDARLKIEFDKTQIRHKWGIPDGSLVIGRLSRLEPTKLVEHTIRAMAHIKKVSKRPVFCIIGGAEALCVKKGWYEAQLKRLAEQEGMTDIRFTGPIYGQEKNELLHLLDINLAPTSFEGYGLIFIEPAYCAIPTVTYDHSANKEVVAGGGIVVPYGDLDALVACAMHLIDDDTMRSEIGNKAKQLVEERNLPSHWCSAVEGVILHLMAELGIRRQPRPIRINRSFRLRFQAQMISLAGLLRRFCVHVLRWLRHPFCSGYKMFRILVRWG